jgi:hypothetical protein
VRPRAQETLVAYQVEQELPVTLPHGLTRIAYPGEWVVSRNDQVIDLLTGSAFEKYYEPIQTGLLLTQTDLAVLNEVLEVGAIKSAERLVFAITRLARLSIGKVEVKFSQSQLDELKTRADKNGHSVQAEVQRVVERLSGDLFWTV